MAAQGMSWEDAILAVLQDTGQPLNYQEITELIGERGLRTLTGAIPANIVNRSLSALTREGKVRRTARGVFQIVDPQNPLPDAQEELSGIDDEEELLEHDSSSLESGVQKFRVAAYGLYWERERVKFGRGSGGVLGRQGAGSDPVDFSNQQGVYFLHQNRNVVYVGRTSDSLYSRLLDHNGNRKAFRWNQFSWFGFREVTQEGELGAVPEMTDLHHMITLLESVLIEALQPPLNAQQGAYLGPIYEQVPDPDVALKQSRDFLRGITGT